MAAMPNTDPVMDNPRILRELRERIERDAVVRVYPHGAITGGLKGEKLVDFAAMADLVLGFSDDGRGVQDEVMMRRAMEEVKRLDKKILAHCEDEGLNNAAYVHEGELSRRLGIRGISSCLRIPAAGQGPGPGERDGGCLSCLPYQYKGIR